SKAKVTFVILLFITSLLSFVAQTELTAYVYSLGYNEPFILLYVTHGSWWIIWPLHVIVIGLFKTFKKYKRYKYYIGLSQIVDEGYQLNEYQARRNANATNNMKVWKGFFKTFKSSAVNQHRNIYHTSEIVYELNNVEYFIDSNNIPRNFKSFITSSPMKYMFRSTFLIMLLLTMAGSSWYVALTLSTGSDVTAIYNCSAFAAYAFAVPFLNERFSWMKFSSVVVAIGGVFIVAYGGGKNSSSSSTNNTVDTASSTTTSTTQQANQYPYRILGNLIILAGAVLYGLYEVVYKKFLCPPADSVSSRRQASFSTFSMSLIGFHTAAFVWIPIFLVHIFNLHQFTFPSSNHIRCLIFGSVACNVIFSVSFLALISLTSPVLSSVASLVTIFFVGITEWLIFGVKMTKWQVVGNLVVIIGFAVLTYASWSEISQEDTEDTSNDTT
ncbi:hypothetical protein PACTADRAFT_21216, partial [Pachysolen tannophilus NRRL Y-2460]